MHEYATCHAIPIDPRKALSTSFRVADYSPDQENIQKYDRCCAHESPFLTDSTEDEVSALFRNETERSLCSVEITLSCESSRTDRNHRLIHVISHTGRILLHSEKHLDTFALVVLKHIVEKEISRHDKKKSTYE